MGQKGYELETSKFLFLSSFCRASKNSLFYICKDMKSAQDGVLDFEFVELIKKLSSPLQKGLSPKLNPIHSSEKQKKEKA